MKWGQRSALTNLETENYEINHPLQTLENLNATKISMKVITLREKEANCSRDQCTSKSRKQLLPQNPRCQTCRPTQVRCGLPIGLKAAKQARESSCFQRRSPQSSTSETQQPQQTSTRLMTHALAELCLNFNPRVPQLQKVING